MENALLNELTRRYPSLFSCREAIGKAFRLLCQSYRRGGKLLLCGNGGSAADTEHMSAELLKGFLYRHPLCEENQKKFQEYSLMENLQEALPAIPLSAFTAFSTAFANDCDPLYTFAQLTYTLGKAEDVLLCISTSGNSKNVILAAEAAKAKEMTTIGLTGESGGTLKSCVDCCICAPAEKVFHVQELHLPIYHCICAMLESAFFFPR